jgi:1-aminocyclopropane-1-carboxylate deaminase
VISGGSMCTAMGILSVAAPDVQIIIVPAWKGCTSDYIHNLLNTYNIHVQCKWDLWEDYHFGGFGKYDQELVSFMYSFTEKTNFPLDPVYTGKMMFAVKSKMESGYFTANDEIVAVHTGGMQGLTGFNYKDPDTWNEYFQLCQGII